MKKKTRIICSNMIKEIEKLAHNSFCYNFYNNEFLKLDYNNDELLTYVYDSELGEEFSIQYDNFSKINLTDENAKIKMVFESLEGLEHYLSKLIPHKYILQLH